MAQADQPAMGLRERKKAKTRAAIQQHALRLFREQGYAATTIEQIAEAAEISPSTFFRYFPTKEDVVLNDENDPRVIADFHAQPAHLSTIQALRRAFRSVYHEMSPDELENEYFRSRLIMTVPEIRATFLNNIVQAMQMIIEAIAKRTGRDPHDPVVRTFAGALMGVGITLAYDWLEDPSTDFMAKLDEAMGYLESGMTL